jgi:RNA polymerase sigma-70 factor (ECF subfamily)
MMNGSVATVAVQAAVGVSVVEARRAPVFQRRSYGCPVLRQEFDADYVERLTGGDQAIEEHFTAYFGELLRVKLSRRGWSASDVEDMCQETFLRVLQTLRRKGGVEHPERIGAYVNSVCNNVVLELCRSHAKHPSADATEHEPVDTAINMEGALIDEERKRFVQVILKEMPEPEGRLLRMVFLEEADREDICKRMNVGRDYLRVILHRARTRFKALADRSSAAAAG